MPPLVPNPLSEEDVQQLQQEVKTLQKTLSATVASNEQKVANLALELDVEKERVLQIEKDKRYIVLCRMHACIREFSIIRSLHVCVNHPCVCTMNIILH